jgi:hypothetical protein
MGRVDGPPQQRLRIGATKDHFEFKENLDLAGYLLLQSASEEAMAFELYSPANAIFAACGARVRQPPIRPESVLESLGHRALLGQHR